MNAIAANPKSRGTFQGVGEVFRFNWPRYLGAALAIVGSIFALQVLRLPDWLRIASYLGIAVVAWWSASSLIASYWVYDGSSLMRWEWIKRELPTQPNRWLNIHAGLDESTPQFRAFWPKASGQTVDIFAPGEMTERSIARARGAANPQSSVVKYDRLPFGQNEFDSIFVLFAAHELRHPAARRAFFNEVRRILAPDGRVVLVEHLRDAANFSIYGPGFAHFHSHKTWHADLAATELQVAREFPFTPFVRVFILKKI
jgi:SAM-dependent methyltransferase